MPLMFREAHATADKKQLNGEWFILENAGATSVSTAGLQVISGKKGKRGSVLGVIDPGFMLQPGEKILVVPASPERSRTATRRRARGCARTTSSRRSRSCRATEPSSGSR